jgi:hypothetical protein
MPEWKPSKPAGYLGAKKVRCNFRLGKQVPRVRSSGRRHRAAQGRSNFQVIPYWVNPVATSALAAVGRPGMTSANPIKRGRIFSVMRFTIRHGETRNQNHASFGTT